MKEAKEFLFEYLKENDTVVLAISGGPDSMALFDVVLEFRKEVPISIICAHVNHKIRIESDSEASFVKEYCDELRKLLFKQNFILLPSEKADGQPCAKKHDNDHHSHRDPYRSRADAQEGLFHKGMRRTGKGGFSAVYDAKDDQNDQGHGDGENQHIHITDTQFHFIFQQRKKSFHALSFSDSIR